MEGSGAGQRSPVPVRNRLFLGVCVQGTPEGGSACMGKLNSRLRVYMGRCVGRWLGAWALGAGLGGISWRGKKTPAFPGFGSTLLES